MGKKRLVTAKGKTMSVSDWAKELGISRARAYALCSEGRLESYIYGDKRVPGRKNGTQERIKEALRIPHSASEVCKIAGCSSVTFYNYVKNHKVTKKDGKYVEST